MEREQTEKNASEENPVQLAEEFCEKDFDNPCSDSKLLKKNHSGITDELDFEDEPSNVCHNMPSSEFHLHDPISEETNLIRKEKILVQEEVEVGELSEIEATRKDENSDSKGEISSENNSDVNDDIEEGEVKDDSTPYDMKNTVCRFFLRGKCVWGINCRFFHVTDKGLYNMFDNVQTRKTFDPPPLNIVPKEFNKPVTANFPQPREYVDVLPREHVEVASSGWDRALNEAKQAILRSKARREEDDYFEEKKLYHSFRDDISHLEKYPPAEKQFRNSNENNFAASKPYYKNYDRSLSFKVLRNKSKSPPDVRLSRKREVKYVKKSGCPEKWQDPWRRSKSPEKRRRWHSSSSSSSKKSECSSVSMSSRASGTCCSSCSVKSLSPVSKSIDHKKVHGKNGSVSRNSRYRSLSRSLSRSRSRRKSWSSISSSSLSSVSSSTSRRSESLKRTSLKDRDEIYRSRQNQKLNQEKNKSRYSPFRSESRSPDRYHSPVIRSPLFKRRRQDSSDMSTSPVSDSRNSNHNRRRGVLQKTDNMNEKSNLAHISKRDTFADNGLVSRIDHSEKMTASDIQLKRTVRPQKVQAKKPIAGENMPQSNVKREKSSFVEEKKTRDKDSNLPKRGTDLSSSHNSSSNKPIAGFENSALEKKQKVTKDKKIDKPTAGCENSALEKKQKVANDRKIDISSFETALMKYHDISKSMRIHNNLSSVKVQKPPTNPPSKPSVSSETVPKQESIKQQTTVSEQKRKITLNLHSKTDKQIKLSEDTLKVKSSKKSNLPPQTSRREHLLKQLKAVEEAIARKKTVI